MVPDALDDAGEAPGRSSQVRHLVQHDGQRLVRREGDEEAERGLPGREPSPGEVGDPVAQIAAHRFDEPTERDGLGLLRGPIEDGALLLRRVGKEERLPDATPTPHHHELRLTAAGRHPGQLEPLPFQRTIQQSASRREGVALHDASTTKPL